MNKCNVFITATLMVLLIEVGSCKKDNSKSADGPKVSDACQLVSQTVAGSISGETYTSFESKETAPVGLKMCDYYTSDIGLFHIGLTQTLAITNSGIKTAKGFYDAMKANYPNRTMVTGVGDEAFFDNATGTIYILYTNDYYITISITQSYTPHSNNPWTPAQKDEKRKAAGLKAIEALKKIVDK